MKPFFTIHAGEYLVGSYIEENFKNCRVWLPSKDTGVDLLVTNRRRSKSVSLQVKFSKDFTHSHFPDFYKDKLNVATWFTLNRSKIEKSEADYWVFVFCPFTKYDSNFMLIKPAILLRMITAIHGKREKYNLYFTITKQNTCWETRGLKEKERRGIVCYANIKNARNFTQFLNWAPIQSINR